MLGAFFKKLFGMGAKDFKPELLIFGLGNPGVKYSGTRHNIGFDVIDGLCELSGSVPGPKEYFCEAECRAAVCGAGGKPVLLVKPLTYMNLSGESAAALVRRYQLTAAECLVIVDDFNIPLGKIRFRKDGTSGGHNGLKSVSAAIGCDYPRLRVGIGPLPAGVSVTSFVLGHFDGQEREESAEAVKTAVAAVEFMINSGIDAAMNKYN
ncbi:MAG: aminoacyl-tRNA hydrolase [Chitinispirillales bacterium]|jgi:PTH1 family peptidyl-tRNA hydrolase|nr:aminoacyl-tRNA hydrolase [Chitinispirillales bacterium]